MFATPTSYSVTPSRKPFMRIPERASTFLRDVKRRSQRVKRSKSLISRNSDNRLSGSFVQLNEEEVRQKYIEDVKKEKEWRTVNQENEDVLHSTLELQCTCACRAHQLSNLSTPLNHRQPPFVPASPTSTIYTPRTSEVNLNNTPRPLKFELSPQSSGHFRKLSSPTLKDLEDKENQQPPPPVTPSFSANRRRCTRRSSLFTPSFKKLAHVTTDDMTPYKKGSARTLPVESKKVKKLGEETGQGRIIPIKQGYLYKKSGSSKMYRRKYVTLCSDGTMTYYPSFQAYVDNLHGKEIHLQHVTVKIPGQKPTGLKSTAVDKSPGGSSSSDEFDKELVAVESAEKKTETKTPKRKRHRLSEEGESSLFELVIVSLDSRQWQFQLCSQEEGEEWVSAIQQQIHVSLRSSGSASAGGSWSSASPETDGLRSVPGNSVCADCGAGSPAWASLNLGTLICIECSGIHRNLGTHISKVRSLDLDSWSQANLDLMQTIGNTVANTVWEHALRAGNTSSSSLEFWNKPGPDSAREDKENFIKSKYLSKNFICESVLCSEDLVTSIESGNMVQFLEALVNLTTKEINSLNNSTGRSALHFALESKKFTFAQLLVWNNADVSDVKAGLAGDFSEFFNQSSAQAPQTKKACPRESQLL